MTPSDTVLSDIETRDVKKVAALDIGSNSFHLVVARIVAGSVQIVHRVKQKVRLAEGLVGNKLSEEAIQRGLDTMAIIAESLKGFEPDSVRIVATHTLRKANNASKFIARSRQILPYPVEVISGTEEARLIYSGVAHTSHSDGQRLVIDIGGGSTEFIIGEGFQAKLCRSVQMGCVSYTTRFFPQGELKAKAFNKAITAAQQALELIEDKYIRLGWQDCIGTSGTIKTIIALCQENAEKDAPVTLKQLKDLMKKCIDAKHTDALDFPDLSEDRRPVLAAGLAILIGAFKSLNVTSMQFSPAALREGVLYQMSDALVHADIRGRTAQSLATRYDVDTEQATLVHTTALTLFDACNDAWQLDATEARSMLSWAALLHEVGLQINSRRLQRHGAYILQNVDMPGFNQEQQLLLSTLVRYQRKKIRRDDIPEFDQYATDTVYKLIVLLRLAALLNLKRQVGFLSAFDLAVTENHVHLTFEPQWLDNKPIFEADLLQESHYLKALDIEFSFR
ncbi:exopolyphosphatase [Alteromonas oceanisediminis]|uniref:exopolyphosphatase n=1 Tax=Alteromonas oceanisediminis TaxID=2836180 RepID=UPI001BD92A88|nr:exopolyphosphatase [Alteromonas oceanisediminis]MBT0585150.1 exopolyphosphatase [Alteromonas oceanisediminis]